MFSPIAFMSKGREEDFLILNIDPFGELIDFSFENLPSK